MEDPFPSLKTATLAVRWTMRQDSDMAGSVSGKPVPHALPVPSVRKRSGREAGPTSRPRRLRKDRMPDPASDAAMASRDA